MSEINWETASKINLRPAASSDENFFAELYAGTRREEFAVLEWDEAQLKAFLKMQYDFQKNSYAAQFPNAEIYAIEADEKTVGRMIVETKTEEIRLVDIALIPEMRGQGIGNKIIRDLQTKAETGGQVLSLHVLQANQPAVALYRKCGFKIVGSDSVYHKMEWRVE